MNEDRPLVGNRRYEVLRCLGQGGMGVVYEALDRERDQRVALKTMRRLEPHLLLRFKQEFRALKGLDHPNLASLLDLFVEDGRWFFTMELVDGVSFLHWVRGGAAAGEAPTLMASSGPGVAVTELLTPSSGPARSSEEVVIVAEAPPSAPVLPPVEPGRLRAALAQLAEGLAHLHREGKVHRDVKPSNVMVTPAGRLVLLDFGLVADAASGLSSNSSVVGTAEYMAPEQGAGQPVGAAADCYAVGVMLYEALTGRLPFVGTSLEVLGAKQQRSPPPPAPMPGLDDIGALCMELLQLDPAARPSAEEILDRCGGRSGPAATDGQGVIGRRARLASQAPSFVGRVAELRRLADAFEATRRGRPTIVLVEGPSGVGKSALVRRFTRQLEDEVKDLVVLSGRYYEREAVPYRALDGIMDAVSRFLMRLPTDAAEAILPIDAPLLATLFPSLRGVEAVAKGSFRPPALDPQEQRTRVLRAVRELFVRLCRKRPVVVVIDDVQWSDADSRAVLAETLRPPEGPPVLALFTLRRSTRDLISGERALGMLQPLAHVEHISLGPLPAPEARALAANLLGRPADPVAAAIAAEAEGHPLFIDALARHALAGGTGRVRIEDALMARIDELEPPARHVLELCAIAGRPLPEREAERAAGLDRPALTRTISALRLAHLVRMTRPRDEDALEPYHDRIRELVAGGLDAAARRARHQELARVLESLEHGDPEQLFIHWRGAGNVERTLHYGTLAAARASEQLAFDRAARLYREVVNLSPEGEARRRLRARLGEALANAGRGPEAAEAFNSAVPGASASEALELGRRAAEQLLRSGRIDAGFDAVRTVLGAVGLKMPKTPRRALASLLFRRALLALRGHGFREREASELPRSELTRIDVCWTVSGVLGMVDTIRGAHFQSLHLWMALRAGEPFRLTRALGLEAAYSAATGTPAARRTARLLAGAESLIPRTDDDPYARGWVRGVTCASAALEGRWKLAHEKGLEAEEIFRAECGTPAWELGTFQFFITYGLAFTGQMRELADRVPRLLREAEDRGDLYSAAAHRCAQSNLAWLVPDDIDGARERVREAMARWSRRGFQVEHFWEMLAEGQIALYAGDAPAADRRVGEGWAAMARSLLLRVQLTRIEAVQLRARVALALAMAGEAGSPRKDLLATARRLAAKIARERAPWATPLADLLKAGVAHGAGDPEAAVEALRRARTGLDAADMRLYGAAASHRLGGLLGGDEGRELREGAEDWMRSEGIVRPDRMVAMLAPGFGP